MEGHELIVSPKDCPESRNYLRHRFEFQIKVDHNQIVLGVLSNRRKSIVSPARKLFLRPAKRHAVLPGGQTASLLDILRDHEALD